MRKYMHVCKLLYSYSYARLDIMKDIDMSEDRQTDALPSIPCRVSGCSMFDLRGNAHIAIWESRWSGTLFGLRFDGWFQSGTARFARAGAAEGLSRTVMRRVGLGLQVACLIGGRLIWLQQWLIGKGAWGWSVERTRHGMRERHSRFVPRLLPHFFSPSSNLLAFCAVTTFVVTFNYFLLITASSSLSHHFRFLIRQSTTTNPPSRRFFICLAFFPTSIANRAPIFSLSTTMKSAIAIAAASAALANAAATPVQVAARAETSSATSSGSVPQVSVKGNGT